MLDLSVEEFEKLVGEALDQLPEKFAAAIENLSVTVEEEPTVEDLESVGLDPGEDTLFGLYTGVPLPDRDSAYSALPDQIVIYRSPILEACRSAGEVVEEVRGIAFSRKRCHRDDVRLGRRPRAAAPGG